MSVFEEMWTPGEIGTHRELQEIEAMVSQTIERGFVLEIPVARKQNLSRAPFERWFLEKESGVIFALLYFGERSNARWDRVLLSDIREFSQLSGSSVNRSTDIEAVKPADYLLRNSPH